MNLLIVDDQPNVLAALALSIDWTAVGISKLFTATSVLLAKKVIEDSQVDIVLTDIEMPIENGLSLVRWISENHPRILSILITSHPNFLYAKQAISLNVCDYILQPAKNEEVIEAVQKAIHRIHKTQEKQLLAENQLFTVEERNYTAKRFIESWPLPSDQEFSPVLEHKIDRIRKLGLKCQGTETVYLFLTEITEWHNIPLDNYEMLFLYKEIIRDVTSYILGRDITYVHEDNRYISVLLLDKPDPAISDYMDLIRDRTYQRFQCITSIAYLETDFSNIRTGLTNLLSQITDAPIPQGTSKLSTSASRREAPSNYVQYYESILHYIEEHIEESISRSDLAAHIHVSTDYLSHIVRQMTDDSLKVLVTRKKMNHARQLLLRSDLPIGEIALKCGYDSFAYFSKVYRSMFQESPTDTRKNR